MGDLIFVSEPVGADGVVVVTEPGEPAHDVVSVENLGGGFTVIELPVEVIVDNADMLEEHINSPTPHPAYDDMPNLKIILENGLI